MKRSFLFPHSLFPRVPELNYMSCSSFSDELINNWSTVSDVPQRTANPNVLQATQSWNHHQGALQLISKFRFNFTTIGELGNTYSVLTTSGLRTLILCAYIYKLLSPTWEPLPTTKQLLSYYTASLSQLPQCQLCGLPYRSYCRNR